MANASAPRLVTLSGSLRPGSYNLQLVRLAGQHARAAGAEVVDLDLAELDLPLFSETVEKQGFPAGAQKLKAELKAADGFLIASPEHNSSLTAALKNAIDWATRPEEGEQPLAAFAGKTAAIMAASPGALGGLRGLVHLKAILGNIQVTVIPNQHALSQAHQAFDSDGSLKDPATSDRIQTIAETLVAMTAKLKQATPGSPL